MAFPVAVIQMDVDPLVPAANDAAAIALLQDAFAAGARLAVLPEAFLTDLHRESAALAVPIPGPLTERFRSLLDAFPGALLALPLLEREGERVYSALALLNAQGVLGVARKTHLHRDATGLDSFHDAEVLSSGASLSVFSVESGGETLRIGVALGFDAEFPEVFRTLALRGADLAVVALNQDAPDLPFLQSMAARNRLPLLVANRLGFKKIYPAEPEYCALQRAVLQDRDGTFLLRCRGASAIIDAQGRVVAVPPANTEDAAEAAEAPAPAGAAPLAHFQEPCVLQASFKLDELRLARATDPRLAARRGELYV